jgi:hypothetical protein
MAVTRNTITFRDVMPPSIKEGFKQISASILSESTLKMEALHGITSHKTVLFKDLFYRSPAY